MPAFTINKNANVISSHIVCRIKEDLDGMLKLKARLFLHVNSDKDLFTVRRDSASADLAIIRMVLSLALVLNFDIATADVKATSMQSGPIKRQISVRSSRTLVAKEFVWKLTRLPYVIVYAGRRWLCAVKEWMTKDFGLERIDAVDQLFHKKEEDGPIVLFVAKVVDDFIITGATSSIEKFIQVLDQAIILGQIN